jgi:hypothetical protein
MGDQLGLKILSILHEEVHKDGVVEPFEKDALQALLAFLRVSSEDYETLCSKARPTQETHGDHALDWELFYSRVRKEASFPREQIEAVIQWMDRFIRKNP